MRTPTQAFTVPMASAATQSSAIDLQKSFNKLSLVIPTMASGSDITIYGCQTATGTFRQMFHQPTGASAAAAFSIASSITNCIVPLPNFHVQYLKIGHTTATTDSSYSYVIICSD